MTSRSLFPQQLWGEVGRFHFQRLEEEDRVAREVSNEEIERVLDNEEVEDARRFS